MLTFLFFNINSTLCDAAVAYKLLRFPMEVSQNLKAENVQKFTIGSKLWSVIVDAIHNDMIAAGYWNWTATRDSPSSAAPTPDRHVVETLKGSLFTCLSVCMYVYIWRATIKKGHVSTMLTIDQVMEYGVMIKSGEYDRCGASWERQHPDDWDYSDYCSWGKVWQNVIC